jgi:cyclopropane fatty-acyl-phospholipid synthase-like methyltransferase
MRLSLCSANPAEWLALRFGAVPVAAAEAWDATADDLGSGYDAVLCFNLVHHLAPEQIVGLFRRTYEALVPGGVLAVMDAFAEPGRRASAAANTLGMFAYLSSGSEIHTPSSCAAGSARPASAHRGASASCESPVRPFTSPPNPVDDGSAAI